MSEDARVCYRLLNKTSRSFAAVIQALDTELRSAKLRVERSYCFRSLLPVGSSYTCPYCVLTQLCTSVGVRRF